MLAKGRDVIALTRDSGRIEPRANLRVVQTDYATLDIPTGSTVVHLAAVRNAPRNRPSEMRRVNVEMTEHIGRLALRNRAAHFIHLGSALVLGSSEEPLRANAPLTADADPYVASKVSGIRALEALEGLPLVTLLPAIVYGPDHPRARNRITSHVRRILRGRWRIAVGGPAAARNLVFVDDVIRAIERAPARGRQLVAGENTTQDELERRVFEVAGREPTPRIVVPRPLARAGARAVGWSRRMDTLLAPWCFVPSPNFTPLVDGIARTVRSL